MLGVALALLGFVLALMSDYLETRYVRAVARFQATGDHGEVERAARASVAMWTVGMVGFVAVLQVGWWVALPEGLGLYIGTKLALRRAT